ncbi:uroporphyrinogen-III synthase [Halobacillus salinarum]|uniref:Uroporphyrinogen-III synthase n=1 Tax=Halobacillus salinarum TaxID=2932257 RepID=A0ABY4EIS3_9BACI|nr:uroporphyrinogen-III synthase [Halobacillus salinarum]UOQ44362.1 uroporphyrinogen-III synthase [Halobacillus salinarum]
MSGLTDKHIGIAASRQAENISKLIEKQGGTSRVFSIQGKQQLNEQTCRENVGTLIDEPFNWAVLTTGIGARTLEDSAVDSGLQGEFIKKLSQLKLAVRGSKTLRWMKEHNLNADLTAEDGTMDNLFHYLKKETNNEQSQRIFLQAYNQDDAELKESLEQFGFSVYLSKPYKYERPDPKVLEELETNILSQTLDAVVFTSKTQVQNLLLHTPRAEELVNAFNEGVLAVAVGKVTASELERAGISEVLQPEQPKMGAMIVSMVHHYNERQGNPF